MRKAIEVTGKMVIDMRAREWCKMPYPNHPKGCPNYGKRSNCPPQAPLVGDYFDLEREHWFLIVDFDMASHIEKMKSAHPDWSERQCACCLYWQGGVRKQLREFSEEFTMENFGTVSSTCPEAMGVNIFSTFLKIGMKMTKDPKETVYKVALVGYLK